VRKVVGREESKRVPVGRELTRLLLEKRADRDREGGVAVVVVDEVVAAVAVEVCGVHPFGLIPDHDPRRWGELAALGLRVEENNAGVLSMREGDVCLPVAGELTRAERVGSEIAVAEIGAGQPLTVRALDESRGFGFFVERTVRWVRSAQSCSSWLIHTSQKGARCCPRDALVMHRPVAVDSNANGAFTTHPRPDRALRQAPQATLQVVRLTTGRGH
jgi:hypothetical protein